MDFRYSVEFWSLVVTCTVDKVFIQVFMNWVKFLFEIRCDVIDSFLYPGVWVIWCNSICVCI